MAGRTYTQEQREAAVALYVEHGACETARRTGIPQKTISSWAARAGVQSDAPAKTAAATERARQVAEAKRVDVQAKLLERAERMLDRMTEPEVDFRGKDADEVLFPEASAAACKSFATSAAILIDKFRLEMGEATERHEHGPTPERTPEQEAELAKVVPLLQRVA